MNRKLVCSHLIIRAPRTLPDKYVHKKYLASSVPPVKVAAKSVTKPTQASSSRTAQVKRAPQTPARHQTQEQKEYPQNKEKVERRTADSSPSEAAVFDPLVKTERLDVSENISASSVGLTGLISTAFQSGFVVISVEISVLQPCSKQCGFQQLHIPQ